MLLISIFYFGLTFCQDRKYFIKQENRQLYIEKTSNKYALYNETGALTDPIFDNVELLIPFEKPLTRLQGKIGDKVILIDTSGNLLTNDNYSYLNGVRSKNYIITTQDKLKGIIDWNGDMIVGPQYEHIRYFKNESITCFIVKRTYSGVIDSNGWELVPLEYWSINQRTEWNIWECFTEDSVHIYDFNGLLDMAFPKAYLPEIYTRDQDKYYDLIQTKIELSKKAKISLEEATEILNKKVKGEGAIGSFILNNELHYFKDTQKMKRIKDRPCHLVISNRKYINAHTGRMGKDLLENTVCLE